MNCRAIAPLLLAERDGVLTDEQHAALDSHVAGCSACQRLRATLSEATLFLKTDAANVPVPGVETEWSAVQAKLSSEKARVTKKRPLAPVIWFGAPLAAAAALAFMFFSGSPPSAVTPAAKIARAAPADPDDTAATTMAYVDKDSGWLVVWSTDPAAKS